MRALALSVVAIVVVGAAVVSWIQLSRPVPTLGVHRVALQSTTVVPGTVPSLPWPATGEAAIAVPASGTFVASGPETPVPIASLTKIMTAYVILRDHPLAPDAQGPTVTVDADDQTEAGTDLDTGATMVPVQAGEVLSQRQLLNGLLVHSANNFADILARWDAGSVPAFVAKMNATASTLGMHDTHYADANGLHPQSESSAGDQLRLSVKAMAIATFAAVVDQTQVTEPLAGMVTSYVPGMGTQGIVGVKSGFTQAAMGCLVLAADRVVDGRSVLVLASVTGQPGDDPLLDASNSDLALINASASALRVVPVVAARRKVATVTVAWSKSLNIVTERAVSIIGWPGQLVRVKVGRVAVHQGARAGTTVARLAVQEDQEHVAIPVVLSAKIPAVSLGWRLSHG